METLNYFEIHLSAQVKRSTWLMDIQMIHDRRKTENSNSQNDPKTLAVHHRHRRQKFNIRGVGAGSQGFHNFHAVWCL